MATKKVKAEEVPVCPGCGHRFYRDSPFYKAPDKEGLCRYCVEEKEQDG